MPNRVQRVAELRERAQHYRRLALGPMPWTLVSRLEDLADECDDEARKLANVSPRWPLDLDQRLGCVSA